MLSLELLRSYPEPFSDIVEKLKINPTPNRTFDLISEPTKDELKYLVANYKNEFALNHISWKKSWQLIEGINHEQVNIPSQVTGASDIEMHSHPAKSTHLPSITDLFDINPNVKNFILTIDGLTYFSEIKKHPLTGNPWQPKNMRELKALSLLTNITGYKLKLGELTLNEKSLKKFLEKTGITIIKKSWEELPNNPLSGFFQLPRVGPDGIEPSASTL